MQGFLFKKGTWEGTGLCDKKNYATIFPTKLGQNFQEKKESN